MSESKSEKEMAQEVLEQIYRTRMECVLSLDSYVKKMQEIMKAIAGIRDKMVNGTLDVKTGKEIIKAYCEERNTLKEERQAIKLLYAMEGKLQARLAEIKHGLL